MSSKKNARQWKKSEDEFLSILKDLGDDPHLTKGSGSVRSTCDIVTPNASVEVKSTESESFSISRSIIDNLVSKSVSNNGLCMLYIDIAPEDTDKSLQGVFLPIPEFSILYKFYLDSIKGRKI